MAPTDRVIIGKNPNDPTTTGVWVSKPGANVSAIIGIPPGKVYGYQIEDFSELGTSFIVGPANFSALASSWYNTGYVKAGGTTGKNLIFSGNYGFSGIQTKALIDPPGVPISGLIPDSASFIGSQYPIIEIKVRRTWGGNDPDFDPAAPNGSQSSQSNVIGMGYQALIPGSTLNQFPQQMTTWIKSVNGVELGGYAHTWREIFPSENEWKILEFDMDICNFSSNSWDNLSPAYRIISLRWFPYYYHPVNEDPPAERLTWDPQTNPMWEIEYIRVKKRGTPIEAGATANRQREMLFDSDATHMGLVHQTGTVTIGTAKALINGNTSNRVAGHVVDESANGYVSFPELDYIPLVLFQRIDNDVGLTGSSYPGGEDEFSICTQEWEDHRYPTVDLVTSEPKDKSFDIKTVEKINSAAYFDSTGKAEPMHENFYSYTSGTGPNKLTSAGTTQLAHYQNGGADFSLPWTGSIPSDSNRAGIKFSDLVQSFSEVRTFAYARAKKDGFWLTCRNAIAQEGLEPVLNLAPVLPEKGIQDRGNSAFTAMQFQTDNGAWGMFHPALALYDGQKFTEGIQLKWDSKVTANSVLLDKIGQDYSGSTYPQYRWSPSFSVSGLPFNGALARPNGPAPTEKNEFYMSYVDQTATPNEPRDGRGSYTANGVLRGDTGGFYPYRYQCNEWVHDNDGSVHSTGIQYNIKRLSSAGIFHPHGVVPETSLAFDNKNTDFLDMVPGDTVNVGVYNQTAYIGGAKNKRFPSSKVYTIDFRTDERWPDEPQRSYFKFGGSPSNGAEPYFALSPPGVAPESILYTATTEVIGNPTAASPGGELMIANIDGTNVRLFHDFALKSGGKPAYVLGTITTEGAGSPNPGAVGGAWHRGIEWGPEKTMIGFTTRSAGGASNRPGLWFKRIRLDGPPGDEIFCGIQGSDPASEYIQATSDSYTVDTPLSFQKSLSRILYYISAQDSRTYTGIGRIDGEAGFGLAHGDLTGGEPLFIGQASPGGAGSGGSGSPGLDYAAGEIVKNPIFPHLSEEHSAYEDYFIASNNDGSEFWVLRSDDGFAQSGEIGINTIWSLRKSVFSSTSISPPIDGPLSFSHDGKLMAFSRGGDIYVGDFSTPTKPNRIQFILSSNPLALSDFRNLTNHASDWALNTSFGIESYDPKFSSDGRKIFFKTKITDPSNINTVDWRLQYSNIYPEDVEYDSDFSNPPTYKYWVLRVPVSFPEYT